ncbi:MAG TPA: hypothetical protein VM557_14900 [Thermoanaerobaculia bacterium]|nr:hypothetical protein [Thermoanaerobaculia bacterium]
MIRTIFPLALVLICLIALPACEREVEPPAIATATAIPSAPDAGQDSSAEASKAAPSGITYQLPAGWNRTARSSSMRIDQAVIPGPGGSAEMAVFFFGAGGGGGVQENLERWASQVESTASPAQETFQSNGLTIHWMDVSGTLKASTMGMGPSSDQPNSRMFAAVVEGEGGPWFFKVTGPASTLDAQRDVFLEMLRTVRTAGTSV